MIARERWYASWIIFLSITFCGSTTRKPTLWSIRSWTAGEEEHANGDHATELCQRNKMGACGRILARSAPGEYDSCLRHHSHGRKREHRGRGRCLRPGGADA